MSHTTIRPTRSLLEGMPYVRSEYTDIRTTFARFGGRAQDAERWSAYAEGRADEREEYAALAVVTAALRETSAYTKVGREMVEITNTVHAVEEWSAISDLLLMCMHERDEALIALADKSAAREPVAWRVPDEARPGRWLLAENRRLLSFIGEPEPLGVLTQSEMSVKTVATGVRSAEDRESDRQALAARLWEKP